MPTLRLWLVALILGAACGRASAQARFEVTGTDGAVQAVTVTPNEGLLRIPLPDRGLARLLPDLHRVVGSVEFEVEVQLDEETSEWRMTWLSGAGRPQEQSGYALGLRFDPVYGAKWRFRSVVGRGPDMDVVELELPDVPEPPDLLYRLRVLLPADGGLRITLPDGRPLVHTGHGDLQSGTLAFYQDGAVRSCRLQPPQSLAAVPEDLAMLWRALPRDDARLNLAIAHHVLSSRDGAPLPDASTLRDQLRERWGRAIADRLPTGVLREVDTVKVGEVAFDRLVQETVPRLEVPLFIARPDPAEGRSPGVLLLPSSTETADGGPGGKCDPRVLALSERLVRAGAVVLIADPLGGGERRDFQPHDGRGDLHLRAAGSDPEGLLVEEAAGMLDLLASRTEVDDQRLTVLALGDAGPVGTGLALFDDRVRAVAIEVDPRDSFDRSVDAPARNAALIARLGQASGAGPWTVVDAARWQALGERLLVAVDTTSPLGATRWGLPADTEVRFHEGALEDAAAQHLGLPAFAPSALSMEEWRQRSEELVFGELEVASLWDSWMQGEAFAAADAAQPHLDPRPLRQALLETLRTPDLPVAPVRVLAIQSSKSRGAVALVESAFGTRTGFLALSEDPDTAFPDVPAARLLPTGTRRITLCLGDHGALHALEEARRHLPAREGECWLGLDLDGRDAAVSPVTLDQRAWNLEQSVAGWWVRDLRSLVQRLRQDAAQPLELRWFGVGAHGVLATAAAFLEAPSTRSLTTLHCISEWRQLLEVEPRHRGSGPPSPLWSEHPHPLLFVPGILQHFEVEDLVLGLLDAEVQVEWLAPRGSLGEPLTRARELARWPRLQHRERLR